MVLINTGTYDANDNHGPLMNRVAVAMMLISLVATCLRIFARRLVHQQLWWDDWFTPIALAFSWGVTIIHIIGSNYFLYTNKTNCSPLKWRRDWSASICTRCVANQIKLAVEKGNFGRHILPTTMPSEIVRFLKCLFGVQVGYPIAIAAIKFSILFFYRRIFSIGPTKLPLVLLGAVVAAWAIAMVSLPTMAAFEPSRTQFDWNRETLQIIMGIFSCRPVRGFWMREEIPTVCMSEVTYLLAVAIPNVVTDIVLIIFPLPILWSLKVTMSHRIALSGIFLIGGLWVSSKIHAERIALSLTRTPALSSSHAFVWSQWHNQTATPMSLVSYILTCCFPT